MKIVVIGGVAGGASACARLRRLNEHAQIILLEQGRYISFANCGLPYYIGGAIEERKDLFLQTPEAMRCRFNVDVRIDSRVVGIDRNAREVEILHQGALYRESYDKIILAPGSSALRPHVPGTELENVFMLHTIPDTDRLQKFLKEKKPTHALVVGGGFIGLEMVENLSALGLTVTLAEMSNQVMSSLDWEMAQYIHRELNRKGVAIKLEVPITAIKKNGDTLAVCLGEKDELSCDLVIIAAGIIPNSELAKSAGLQLNKRGYIVTDPWMRTSDPHIYAVGDAVEAGDFMTGGRAALPLAGPANRQGRLAADSICDRRQGYKGTQGTFIAKIFSLAAGGTGMTEKKLKALGCVPHQDYDVLYTHPIGHASYYPNSTHLHMKLLFHPASGKILGAQVIGSDGADKRIDVLATCIRLGGTVTDLSSLELAYAPPYNTAKDPVNFLGYLAENILDGLVETVQWHELPSLSSETTTLVDVRTPEEFSEGAIPGAISIPVDDLRTRLGELSRNKTIVVYCRVGIRSYLAARILMQEGFSTRSLMGGWITYEASGYIPR